MNRTAFVLGVAFEVGLGVIACAIGIWLDVAVLGKVTWSTQGIAIGSLAAAPPLAAFWLLDRFDWQPVQDVSRQARRMLAALFERPIWWAVAVLSLAAGWGEELLFRGLLQDYFADRYGTLAGVSLASLAFGLMHPISRTYVFMAAAIGVYFGSLYLWTGDLTTAVVAHAVYDFLAIYRLFATDNPRDEKTDITADNNDEAPAGDKVYGNL